MELVYEIENILKACIFIIGLSLSLFFFKNRDTKSNLWLAGLNLSLAFHFLNLYLLEKIQIPNFGLVFGLMYGPIMMFFIKAHRNPIKNKCWLHFLPGLILFIWIVILQILNSRSSIFEIYLLQLVVFVHLLVYLILSFNESRTYKKIALQTRSQINDDKISLIQNSIILIGTVYMTTIIQSFLNPSSSNMINQVVMIFISIIILIGMCGIIYQGMEKPHIYSAFTPQESDLATQINQYASSGLTDSMANQYVENLMNYMSVNKPYRLDDITIDKLAEMTEIPPRHLSQIINQKLKQNFFDFINSYRISDAQKQLVNFDKRISEIMYDVGFSSRSSFNSAFKKYSGRTPSQYRSNLNKF